MKWSFWVLALNANFSYNVTMNAFLPFRKKIQVDGNQPYCHKTYHDHVIHEN